ncbi:MAG TPA: glycosyltransferase family 1 protein [Noviherbaspirillum sp.]|nr:glycosyltransferase family 1 protein [Noviherbaspirillum sp.]
MNIRDLIQFVKVQMMSRLPVTIARRYFQASERPANTHDNAPDERQLLVDVSVIINNDARTGIQRVVRALLLQLLMRPPTGYRIRPVFSTRRHGYHYAPEHFGLPDAEKVGLSTTSAVTVQRGDFFLGLDLSAHLLPLHKSELASWKRAGVNIHVVVYDLLPILYPQWFNAKTTRNFYRWLRTVAIFADGVTCISNTVKAELGDWLCQKYSLAPGTIPVSIIPLGADIESSSPSRGLPKNAGQLLAAFSHKPTILMVGTLEPRKGHSQVLAAFEELWKRDYDVNLVIVGKPGWQTETLQHTLRTHVENHSRLYWLEDASDELLGRIYAIVSGVIVASRAEGYGLPLVEALRYARPVLARDIPIFREIADPNLVTFFKETGPSALAETVVNWLAQSSVAAVPKNPVNVVTWRESARVLARAVFAQSEGA